MRSPLTPRIVAIANQKGGVGKTTTAVNLAVALAQLGKETLLLDIDPQANASLALGYVRDSEASTSYDVIISGSSMATAVRDSGIPKLRYLPSAVDLAAAEIELVAAPDRESRLTTAIATYIAEIPPAAHPDFIVIDCPPSLGLLTVNALVAANELAVPMQSEFYSLDGVGQLVRTVNLVRVALNPKLRITMVCLTMVDTGLPAHQHAIDEVRSYLGANVAATLIPRDELLSISPSVGTSALIFAPQAPGAVAYRALAAELLLRDPVLESIQATDQEVVVDALTTASGPTNE